MEENGPDCADGVDNDCDGLTDCDDPTGCAAAMECQLVCGNGYCTSPDEDRCTCALDCGSPSVDETGAECFDGIDNDCNGLTDCADPENCAGLP